MGVLESRSGAVFDEKASFTDHATTYVLDVLLYDNNVPKTPGFSLDQSLINKLEYTNEVNKLCMTGSIEYVDAKGYVGSIYGKKNIHCKINITKQQDKTIENGTSSHIDSNTPNSNFLHHFIVSNIEILGRNQNAIIYKIHLISSNWYRVAAIIDYSNFNKDVEPIYDIIKNVLTTAFTDFNVYDGKAITDKSFDNLFPSVKMHYITNGIDTVADIIQYLQNKLFSSKEYTSEYIDQLPLLVYDMFENHYHVIKLNDETTYLKGIGPTVGLSLFGSLMEKYVYQHPIQLGSVVKKNIMAMYRSFFPKNIYHYDSSIDGYAIKLLDQIKPETILGTINNALTPNDGKYENKVTELNNVLFPSSDKISYVQRMSDWNNNITLYTDLVNNILENDTLIINCKGDVSHQPGITFQVTADNGIKTDFSKTTEQKKDDEERNSQIIGCFLVLRTKHIIEPQNKEGNKFSENLVLGRVKIPKTTTE